LVSDHRAPRICIVTDAWHPQVNGVARTLETLKRELKRLGYRVYMITPDFFRTMPCPTYPEIPLALDGYFKMPKLMQRIRPDAVHIATEGPVGWAARRWCIRHDMPFTTAYHTAFPEYVAARTPLKADMLYPLFRHFHAASRGVLVATPTVRQQLRAKGFRNIVNWTRGVDTDQFHTGVGSAGWDFDGPVQLYVGRVAVEKNIEAFLESDVPGTKVVVGDGPAIKKLQADYPAVKFLGPLFGRALAQAYASADVFVFPSVTDTFGLVMIEALACGTPVAAYPVQGPLDVLGADGTGPFEDWETPIAALDPDLSVAIRGALEKDRDACSRFARKYDWGEVARQFVDALQFHRNIVPHTAAGATADSNGDTSRQTF
jgi:glycosyltransferase involved in cell wall biosynthesis